MNRYPTEPVPGHFTNRFVCYFAATRPAFLSVTFIACLLGLACAYGSGISINTGTAILTIFFALVAHAGANVINDYHDARSGADAANTARLYPFTGGSRFIQNNVLTPRQTACFGYTLLAIVIPAGLWLTWQTGPGLLLIGLLGLLCGWAYSAPLLALASRGLGEIAIVAGWLLIIIGTDYVQRTRFSLLPVAAGASYVLLVANLLYINQFPDRESDAATGKHTLVVRLGPETAKWGYLLIALLAYGWVLFFTNLPVLPHQSAAAAITLILSFSAARELLTYADTPRHLRKAIIHTILATNIHGLILAATLAWGRWPV